MRKIWIGSLILLCSSLTASAVPDFKNLSRTKGAVFLLSTPKSGSNLMSSSLSIITRKPISWLNWGYTVFDPASKRTEHPSYNRLKLPLVTNIPLLYRTHYELTELLQMPSEHNKLIFVTRNPKELLFRRFFQQHDRGKEPSKEFIESFLEEYLEPFYVYEKWCSKNRTLVFYEDFIVQENEILLSLLQFIKEKPVYFDDYSAHKLEYKSRLLESYSSQHVHNSGGASSVHGPKPIHYSKDVDPQTLACINDYLKMRAPEIWKSYLSRFE